MNRQKQSKKFAVYELGLVYAREGLYNPNIGYIISLIGFVVSYIIQLATSLKIWYILFRFQ